MNRMLTRLVTSGVETTIWRTLLKEIWREGYRGADKYLSRPGKIQAATEEIVMYKGLD